MFRIILFLCFSVCLHAACECLCVNERVQAVCDTNYEVAPVCAPRVCPLRTPSIPPLPTYTLPPPNKTYCYQAQVYNESTHRYEWQNICE